MKTKLFLFAAAALVAASCTFDETTEVNLGQQIEFRGAMDTRATEMITAGLTDFNATALLSSDGSGYFENLTFINDDGTYKCANAPYWPVDDELTVYAWWPTGTFTDIDTPATITPSTTLADQKDVIVATLANANKDTKALTFSHVLSQITVKAKEDNANYNFEVKDFAIVNVISSMTYDIKTPETTPGSNKATYSSTQNAYVTLDDTGVNLLSNADGSFMLVPQTLAAWNVATEKESTTNTYFAFNVRITATNDVVYYEGPAAVPFNTTWEAGTKYEYVLNFTNGAGYYPAGTPGNLAGTAIMPADGQITFTCNVTQWTERTPESVTM